ncbi:MFS transporter [Sinomonas sp. G460-2]|uniref:MFS transporter n=1 Tax=Sinomonas sp. G460-2 TaxID=3393464 RepID=UPI0039F0ACBB
MTECSAGAIRTRPSGDSSRSTVAALVGACLTAGLLQTVVIPLQSQLPALLGAPRGLTAWVVTGAAAGAAGFAPISGRAGDLYGRKRAAVAVMVVFTVGSITAALTSDAGVMIAARIVEGIAIGVVPLSVSIMRDVVGPERLPGAIALASGMLGGGAAFGMPIGAAIARWFDWHVVFWLCALLGAGCSAWLAAAVPQRAGPPAGRFDFLGAAGTLLGSAALLTAIAQGMEWGWSSEPVLGLIGAGVVALLLSNAWMLRTPQPLIDVRVALRRPVLFTNSAALLINFANMGSNVVLPQLMTEPRLMGLGVDPLTASLVMMAAALSQMLATPFVARMGRLAGPQAMLITGAGIGSAAIAAPAFAPSGIWVIVVVNIVVGVCFAFVFSAFPQVIMASVPRAQIAAANGLNAQIRTFGTSAGAAIPGAILAVQGGPTSAAFTVGLIACASAGLAGAGIGLLVPRRRPRRVQEVDYAGDSARIPAAGHAGD